MSFEATDEMKEFFVEAFEMLEESENAFLQFGKRTDFKTTYPAVFRTFHSLKGAAGMFELSDLQKHMHQLENILSECQPRGSFTQGEISFFLKGIDASKRIISGEKVHFNYSNQNEIKEKVSETVEATVDVAKNTTPQEVYGEIYVIDDEPDILDILEFNLKAANFKVKKFVDPKAALLAIKEKCPDLVFTDMKMPRLSGLDVLKAVREISADLPVVIVSGHLDKDLLINCIQKGAYSAIEKPFKDSFLVSTAITAVRDFRLKKLLQKSLNLLLYQFADLDDFLIKQGKADVSNSIRSELQNLIKTQKEYRKF